MAPLSTITRSTAVSSAVWALAFVLPTSARASESESGTFIASRNQLSACVDRQTGQDLATLDTGSAERLARRLVDAAMRACAAEARAMRSTTTYRRYAEEMRNLRRFEINDLALRIEAERASAI